MKKLSQISKLVTLNSPAFLATVQNNADTRLNKLLNGLVKGEFSKDEEAALTLFNTSSKSKAYQKLKSRLKERLLDKFFLMDSERVMKSRYDKAFYQATRNVFVSQIMLVKDMRNTAVELLKSTLVQTKQYYFTELSLAIVHVLRFDAAFRGEKSRWIYYDRLIKFFNNVLMAEYSAEKNGQAIMVEFSQKIPMDKLIGNKAASAYSKIQELSRKYNSHKIELSKYQSGAWYYTIIGEHRKAIQVCNQCEKYLHDHPHLLQQIRLAEMALIKMENCLAIRDKKNGQQYAMQCERYFNRGNMNWLIFREYDFLLSMHTGNYTRALMIFYEVTVHPKFAEQNAERLEKWKIFEAYLNYVLPSQLPKESFNLFKFLNEISILSKDKKGFNFAIWVAEIILLIEIEDFDKLINIAETFRVYVARYVSRKNNLRSYYFSKLLMVLFKYHFDPVKSEQIGKKFMERLNNITPHYKGNLESIEVIPYDILWELILQKLLK